MISDYRDLAVELIGTVALEPIVLVPISPFTRVPITAAPQVWLEN